MPRRDLTLADKIALLELIKNQPPNTSHRQLAEITGVPKSTIARVLQQQEKLRGEWTLCEGQQGSTQKRKREGKAPEVEEALNQWFCNAIGRGVRVSGPILKKKSEELAKKLGRSNFKATDGWLSRWKCRFRIKFKAHGEKVSVDAGDDGRLKSTKLTNLVQKFCEDNVRSADEADLCFRAGPDDSLVNYKHSTMPVSEKEVNCITVLCCPNIVPNIRTIKNYGCKRSDLEIPGKTESSKVTSREECTCVNNSLQCDSDSNEDCKDTVVDQSVGERQKTSSGDEETDENSITKCEPVSNQDARKFINGLRLYFLQKGNENCPMSALETCADFVQLQSV